MPGQEIPEGELVTVPPPLTVIVSFCAGSEANVAVTLSALFIVITQAPVPEQAPDQPVNLYPRAAAGVSVTFVPDANAAEQAPGQAIPVGELVTVPPLPVTVTVSVSGVVPFCVTENVAIPATTRLPLRLPPVLAAMV